MILLYGSALFTSALLLFWVEPMIGKMILPLFGGASAVWVTCMLFFQIVLLAGYVYAHAATTWLGVRRQALAHCLLLLTPFLVLPLRFDQRAAEALARGESPTLLLLVLLLTNAGLPFFVLSASAPLLQKWFSRIGHPSGDDPYFLYGSSNLGSMLALAAYPFLIEPWIGLRAQARIWTMGVGLLVPLVVACAIGVYRSEASIDPPRAELATQPASPRISGARRLRWIALSFVPSSYLLGVTNYITTDIASIPLLWVVPLSIYLSTFILVFARKPLLPHAAMIRFLPLAASPVVLVMVVAVNQPIWLIVTVHLVAFFFAAMVCHGELGRDRPPADRLTEFFLWMSVGGMLGGIFNSLIAPLIFDRLIEYPMAIIAACLLGGGSAASKAGVRARRLDALIPATIALLTLVLIVVVPRLGFSLDSRGMWLVGAVPVLANYASSDRPIRFGLGVAGMLVASSLLASGIGRVVSSERNFFGVVRVAHSRTGKFVHLADGNTLHGRQSRDPLRAREAIGYYHRTGPIGQLFDLYRNSTLPRRVGIVGLGAGGLAAYARPDEEWTFYEINPIMVRVAQDVRFFTYLRDAFPDRARLAIELGDARLKIAEALPKAYGLLVLDAFSSDAIPPHLLTREALRAYLDKLDDEGFLAFNISNRHLDLKPIVGALARDAGLVAYARPDRDLTDAMIEEGKLPSQWAVMARREEQLADLVRSGTGWQRIDTSTSAAVWTDDKSSLLSALGL
ncbi:MAG TPA: hypothetical protein VF881_05390 [Polyangiaceae bacterium]